MAVAVVREGEVVARGFGVRDVRTGAPVTPETMFHLASVSKPFVATAVVSLATALDGREPLLDLDAPIVEWVPELTLADGREARGHGPGSAQPHERSPGRLGLRLARPAAGRRRAQRLRPQPVGLAAEGGARLGVLLLQRRVRAARAAAVQRDRHDVRGRRAAAGPGPARDARQHVPAQRGARATGRLTRTWGCRCRCPRAPTPTPGATLRARPCTPTWSRCVAGCSPTSSRRRDPGSRGPWARLDPALLDLMWRPVVEVGDPPWEEAAALGWALGHLPRPPDRRPQRC